MVRQVRRPLLEKRGGNISYLFYCVWIRTNILQIWNKKENVKYWRDMNLNPSNLYSATTELWESALNNLFTATLYISSPETTLVKFAVWFYIYILNFCSNISLATSLVSSVLSTLDCKCKGCRFKSLWLLDVCLYSNLFPLVINNGLWLRGLRCLFLL